MMINRFKNWLRRFLVPTPENSFKPNALEQAALVGMAVLVMISFSFANLQSILWKGSDWLVSTILPAVVTDATNAARAEAGREPLTRSALLDEAARLKAEDMANNGYFAHWSPEGVSPWHWFQEVGYGYVHAGENLAVHFTDSSEVVEAWLDSPTHRENIMAEKFTEIGIGTAKGRFQDYDTVFVVQLFGAPAGGIVEAVPPAETVQVEEVAEAEVPGASAEVAGVTEDEPVEEVRVTEEGTVVYESFAATSEPNVSADAPAPDTKASVSFWQRLAISPSLVLQIIYSLIGGLVVLALILSIAIEWRRQHPVQLAYGFAMLAFIALLFRLHVLVTAGAVIA